jgi:hypothetical protein
MADILVQNVIKQVTTAIQANSSGLDYATLFGTSLKAELESIIRAAPTTGPYSSYAGGAGSLQLCDLAGNCYLSACGSNYSGTGTNETDICNVNSIWHNGSVLKGAATVTVQAISDFLTAASPELTELATVSSAVADTIDDDTWLTWLSLKTIFSSEGNSTILLHWYGVGIPSPAGAPLDTTDRIKVCAASDTWKCGVGATCSWTVPAGATRAKFQAWGAGMGSNPGCCCGGQSFSGNGAYAEIVIDVTPGDVYSLCAGCSCQKWCCSNDVPGEGCMSGVTGPGICCFKADGHFCYNANCDSMNGMRCQVGAGAACRRFQSPHCTQSGPCWCGLGEYCYDNSCSTCGVVPVYANCCYNNYCICACSNVNPVHGGAYGHRGIIGGGCLNTDNYGYHVRPPIIDADTGLKYLGGCFCQSFTSNCCCGGCNGSGWPHHPGLGGVGTHTMGGNNNHKGDVGRGGMIQVSWT